MHSALVQELADVCRRDTEVSVPAFRRHRIRAVPPQADRPTEQPHEIGDAVTPWIDPGDTMAPATAVQVRLREAIVRRNHRAAPPAATGSVEIEWARSRELSVKRIGRGVIRIGGSIASFARVSIGIDGLAFTVPVPPNGSAAAAIRQRLASHYQVEIVEESSDSTLVVLTGLAPIHR
jgi:hypothetical protein